MRRRGAIARFVQHPRRWIATLAALCLALSPVLTTLVMSNALAGQSDRANASDMHLHADGSVHHHAGPAKQDSHAKKTDSGKSALACADGCCLGKGCPMCSVILAGSPASPEWQPPARVESPFCREAAGLVPPPPSEPPRI
jgi:hypothetical protein